jgi:hypothetical protein
MYIEIDTELLLLAARGGDPDLEEIAPEDSRRAEPYRITGCIYYYLTE